MAVRRSPLTERIVALERLATIERNDLSVDQRVRQNLAQWYSTGTRPQAVRIRPGFIRRVPALTVADLKDYEIRDRPKTKLPHPPPLAMLASKPRGEGLRVALTLLFLIQTGPKSVLGADSRLALKIERAEDPLGLTDLLAIAASHSSPVKGTAQGSSRESNRREQIVAALKLLTSTGLGMVEVPGAIGSAGRFDDVRMRYETGDRAGPPSKYKRPNKTERTVNVPVDFFLNGWIHALNKREIAMWLMLRSEMEKLTAAPVADEFPLVVHGYERLTVYDLALSVYETNPLLTKYGLIDVQRDPNRREDGTSENSRRNLAPNAFKLVDDGLTADALTTVTDQVREAAARRAKRGAGV